MNGNTLDGVIERLMAVKNARPGTAVQLQEPRLRVLAAARRGGRVLPMLLELEAPLQIVGDIHGQYTDLLRLFEFKGLPPNASYLFLGDYVDRGPSGLECMFLLMALKVKHPDKIHMLRGNHECAAINRIYGFYDECKRRYSIKLWKSFRTYLMRCHWRPSSSSGSSASTAALARTWSRPTTSKTSIGRSRCPIRAALRHAMVGSRQGYYRMGGE